MCTRIRHRPQVLIALTLLALITMPAHALALSGSVSIDGGAAYADSAGVTLDSAVPEATSMRVHHYWRDVRMAMQHTLAIRSDGTLWAWGAGASGQLGTVGRSDARRTAPFQVGTATDWVSADGGWSHSVGLRADGSMWAWGYDQYGVVGDGDDGGVLAVHPPVQIGAGVSWKKIACGPGHTLALAEDGRLWAWGYNGMGQLGDGTKVLRDAPLRIGSDCWQAIACNGYCSAAVRADGTLWTWGERLAPDFSDQTVPRQVGTGSDWTTVEGGYSHFLARRADGTIWAWGSNYYGQLGDGSTLTSYTPVQVLGGSDWIDIDAGGDMSTAIKSDGTIWGWGRNNGGLGDGTTVPYRNAPVRIVSALNDVRYVSTGYSGHVAIDRDGEIQAWGGNDRGQLGDGTVKLRMDPVRVSADPDWRAVAAGTYGHGAAIQADGSLWTWGNDSWCQLGNGTVGDARSPERIADERTWRAIAAGDTHNVAIAGDGTLWAWGSNNSSELGDGTMTARSAPVQISTDAAWTSVTSGRSHNLALKADGTMWAWGSNAFGQLGDGTTVNGTVPVQIGSDTWRMVSAKHGASLAIRSDGTLWAWGSNDFSQLGDGTNIDRWSPVQVGSDNDWAWVAAGGTHSLAVKRDGTLWAWGRGDHGQLGNGTLASHAYPVRIGLDADWRRVYGGNARSYGIRADGSLWGWGFNNDWVCALGNESSLDQLTPALLAGGVWLQVDVGNTHNVGVKDDGSLWCWGYGPYGQLGDNGASTWARRPTSIWSGFPWGAYSANAAWMLPAFNGTRSATVDYRDGSGASLTAEDAIVLDMTPPTAGISSPADGSELSAPSLRVTGSASDSGSGIAKVEVSVDGVTWSEALLAGGGWSANVTLPADGDHVVSARAIDAAGNTSPVARVAVKLLSAVTFADPNLEFAVREALVKPSGPIMRDDMRLLTQLVAMDKHIVDLDGLQHATNLNWLDLTNNSVGDIAELQPLTNLTVVNLWGNQISDLSPLADHTRLTRVILTRNLITDLTPLSGLPDLQELWADENLITSLPDMSAMTSLGSLLLDGNRISDITPIAGLPSLYYAELSRNSLTDVTPLASLPSLQWLELDENRVADLSPLSAMTGLKSLSADGNGISTLPAVMPPNLTYASLNTNAISDLRPLGVLTRLTYLDLYANRLSDIEPLSALVNLNYLQLYGNLIVDLRPLAPLTAMENLNLAGNRITDIAPLSGMTRLTYLNLDSNPIRDVSALSVITTLRTLRLVNMMLTDISALLENSAAGGLGSGDYVSIDSNYLDITEGSQDRTDIQVLIDAGAGAYFTPQIPVPATALTVSPSAADGADGWCVSAATALLVPSGGRTPCLAYYSWDDASSPLVQAPTTQLTVPEGEHTLYYRSVDAWGMAEGIRTAVFKVDTIHPDAPTISPIDPADDRLTLTGACEEGAHVDAVITDGAATRVCVDGDASVNGAFTLACDVSGLADGPLSVSVIASDRAGNSSIASTADAVKNSNVAPVAGTVAFTDDVVPFGTAVSASADVTDANAGDAIRATWTWGDGATSAGSVNGDGGSWTIGGTHTYLTPGVYEIGLSVLDDHDAAASTTYRYVVVYDPSAGFVTGGGWIDSPVGASIRFPEAVGRANFGFVSKYQKGAATPGGQTQFRFEAGDLDFRSSTYDWLVIAGARAQYKGCGTINGTGDYGFMLTAVDGTLSDSSGPDTFRIKIWDRTTDIVVHDNQLGETDDSLAGTQLGGGSVVIHK